MRRAQWRLGWPIRPTCGPGDNGATNKPGHCAGFCYLMDVLQWAKARQGRKINGQGLEMTEEKPKMGRPTSYTPEIGKLICDGLASGKSLRRVCEEEAMPHKATVVRWLLRIEDPMFDDFRAQYANARAVQYELMVDDVVDIADDSTNDYVLMETGEGAELAKFNPEAVARARLRVDTRKWFLSKVLPKFADRQPEKEKPVDDMAAALSKLIDKLPG
jgi:hypothetical protein